MGNKNKPWTHATPLKLTSPFCIIASNENKQLWHLRRLVHNKCLKFLDKSTLLQIKFSTITCELLCIVHEEIHFSRYLCVLFDIYYRQSFSSIKYRNFRILLSLIVKVHTGLFLLTTSTFVHWYRCTWLEKRRMFWNICRQKTTMKYKRTFMKIWLGSLYGSLIDSIITPGTIINIIMTDTLMV